MTSRAQTIAVVVLAIALAVVCACWGTGAERVRVIRPRLGIPALVAPGAEFVLELERSRPFGTASPLVELTGANGESVSLTPVRRHSRGRRQEYSVRLPELQPDGAYSMRVWTGAELEVMPMAVHVRKEWPAELCLVQLADLPELGSEGTGVSELCELIDEINLIAPDLVMLSGDIAYGGSIDRYERLVEALGRFDSPVIVGIGNHEYEGLAGFLTHLRLPRHVVDAGPLRIVSMNTAHGRDQITAEQLRWLERELSMEPSRTPIVQLHHPPFEDRKIGSRSAEFTDLCCKWRVPIVLSGHWHADRVFDASGNDRRDRPGFVGPVFAVTTSAGAMSHPEMSSSGDYHGYRVVRLERQAADGAYALRSYTYDLDGDGEPDPSASHPANMVEVEALGGGRVRIRNGWTEQVPGAHVWIDVPKGARFSQANAGKSLGSRADPDQRGGTQIGVELDLPAHSLTDVELLP